MTICYIFFGRLYFGWRLNILSYLLARKLTAAAGAARFWIHFVYSVDEKTIGPEGNNALYTTAPVLLWTCFVFHAATYNVKTVQPSPKNELYSVYIEAYIYQHEIRNIQHIHTVSSHLFDFLFCFCFCVSVYSHSTNEADWQRKWNACDTLTHLVLLCSCWWCIVEIVQFPVLRLICWMYTTEMKTTTMHEKEFPLIQHPGSKNKDQNILNNELSISLITCTTPWFLIRD